MQPGPCHRHGFAALINGARCIATMQPASPVSIARIPPVDWGCQWTGKYAIKGRLIHAIQPWFVSKDACAEYSGLFKYWVRSIVGTTDLRVTALIGSSSVCEVEFLEMMGHSFEQADVG
jgi:hypothetical protein